MTRNQQTHAQLSRFRIVLYRLESFLTQSACDTHLSAKVIKRALNDPELAVRLTQAIQNEANEHRRVRVISTAGGGGSERVE